MSERKNLNPSKLERLIGFSLIRMAMLYRPGAATPIAVKVYSRWGMRFDGMPNYISARMTFDGTDYSLIEIGEGTTISSYIRVLTHDWSPNTILKGFGLNPKKPVGRLLPVKIGRYCFIGTGSIIMPGTTIGDYSIVGAGTVARGVIEPYSIVLGSPAVKVGDTREYIRRKFPQVCESLGLTQQQRLFGAENE